MYMNVFKNFSACIPNKNIMTSKLRNYVMVSSNQNHKEVVLESLKGDDEGILVFGLNRPSSRNALGHSMTSSLLHAVNEIKSNNSARVLILRSLVPGVFCSGADLKERLKLSNSEVATMVEQLSSLATAIENLKMPTIAAIDGAAYGGGLEISLGCDIRIVSENAKLGLVETKWAILPAAGGSQRLPRIINPSLAKELIFCAEVIDGQKAVEIGLANHAVKQNLSSDAAYQKSLEIGRKILLNGPIGVNMAKVAINKGLETDIATGCKIEQLCYAQVIPTQDRIEGLLAFKEKRSPKYRGE